MSQVHGGRLEAGQGGLVVSVSSPGEAREGDERVDPRFDEAWMERVRTEAQRHQAEWDTYDTDAAK